MPTRYRISEAMDQVCTYLDLRTDRVLVQAGLPKDWLVQDKSDVDGATFFRLWDAIETELDSYDRLVDLAKDYAHGPFVPPVLAFSCAETVFAGLERLAVFKPLIAPMGLRVRRTTEAVTLELDSLVPDQALPASMEVFELAYLMECIRTFTGQPVRPLAVRSVSPRALPAELIALLGCQPDKAIRASFSLRLEDADLVLKSRSKTLWETLEPGLTQQLQAHSASSRMRERVRALLLEALPGGCCTAEAVARRLNVSKRTLQRRLSEEETSFHAILSEVRADVSVRYLKQSDLSVPEISHLLGFKDTSSFFRAFQGWTGTTPGNYRATAQ